MQTKNGLTWATNITTLIALVIAAVISQPPVRAAEINTIEDQKQQAIELRRSGLAEIDQGHEIKAKNLFDDSIAAFDKCLKVEPDNPSLLAEKALVLQEKSILQRERGKSNAASTALKDAFDLYQKALLKNPGCVQYQIGQAKTEYEIADLQFNFFGPAWAWRNFEASIKNLEEVVKSSPSNSSAWRELGNALVAKGRALTATNKRTEATVALEQAQAAYAKALQSNPTDRNTLYAVAQAWIAEANGQYGQPRRKQAAQHSFNQAIVACNLALKSWPSDILTLQCRAEAFDDIASFKLKHSGERLVFLTRASQDYEQLTKLAPDAHRFYEKRAALEFERGEIQAGKAATLAYGKAVQADDRCLELEPSDGYRQMARVAAIYQQGRSAADEKDNAQAKILLLKTIEACEALCADEQLKNDGWQKEAMFLQHRACYKLALIYASEKDYKAAIQNMSDAISGYENSKKSKIYYRDPYLGEGLALWTKARWELAQNDREAAANSLEQASKVFNYCMKRQPPEVIKRYGRGDLLVNSKTLQAKMSQGKQQPISFATAQKAIDKRLAKSDYMPR